jgi:hypothetical protein
MSHNPTGPQAVRRYAAIYYVSMENGAEHCGLFYRSHGRLRNKNITMERIKLGKEREFVKLEAARDSTGN